MATEDLEIEANHDSGQLRNGAGPYLFIPEIPENQEPKVHIVLKVWSLIASAKAKK